MKYAIKIPMPDGGWLYVTETKEDGSRDIKTYNTNAEAQRDNTWVWNNKGEVVECNRDPFGNPTAKLTEKEIEELRAKKQAIKEELYDIVKMEMFKASSKLEGIDYEDKEVLCKTHPDAPHGFDRDASQSLGRYVCECEYWEPDWEPDNTVKGIHDWSELKIEPVKVLVDEYDIQNRKELKQLLESMIQRINLLEDGNNHSREITDEEYELFEKLKKIWLYSVPEKSGQYFICGDAGDRDASGLPEKIMVCPAYGSDGFAIYTKTTDYSAPGY